MSFAPHREPVVHLILVTGAGMAMADEKKAQRGLVELETFVENVNKKDKVHGKKVTFGFVKRKRGR